MVNDDQAPQKFNQAPKQALTMQNFLLQCQPFSVYEPYEL